MLYGIDVSSYQPGISMAEVAREGFAFAFCKATEGTGYTNPDYAQQIAGAKAAGLVAGAYHFLSPGNGAGQADYFLSVVGNPAGLVLVLDVEAGAYADVMAFVAEIERRIPGYHPVIYSGSWFWSGHLGNPPSPAGCPLWDSKYVTAVGPASAVYAGVPASYWTPGYGSWQHSTILQFTSNAVVAGFQRVDASAFLGTVDQLRALACGYAAPKPAQPAPKPPASLPEAPEMILLTNASTQGTWYILGYAGHRPIGPGELTLYRNAGVPVRVLPDAEMPTS